MATSGSIPGHVPRDNCSYRCHCNTAEIYERIPKEKHSVSLSGKAPSRTYATQIIHTVTNWPYISRTIPSPQKTALTLLPCAQLTKTKQKPYRYLKLLNPIYTQTDLNHNQEPKTSTASRLKSDAAKPENNHRTQTAF